MLHLIRYANVHNSLLMSRTSVARVRRQGGLNVIDRSVQVDAARLHHDGLNIRTGARDTYEWGA